MAFYICFSECGYFCDFAFATQWPREYSIGALSYHERKYVIVINLQIESLNFLFVQIRKQLLFICI